jgi:hypothetical protein
VKFVSLPLTLPVTSGHLRTLPDTKIKRLFSKGRHQTAPNGSKRHQNYLFRLTDSPVLRLTQTSLSLLRA